MKKLYCGGRFEFDYRDEDYLEKAEEDYRALILDDVNRMLWPGEFVPISDDVLYVGPFYYEMNEMADRGIVKIEKAQIEQCTHAFFLLEDGICPGTVAELIYAASLNKQITIFSIQDFMETESTLHSACWYPIIMAQEISNVAPEIIHCKDLPEAHEKILQKAREL